MVFNVKRVSEAPIEKTFLCLSPIKTAIFNIFLRLSLASEKRFFARGQNREL